MGFIENANNFAHDSEEESRKRRELARKAAGLTTYHRSEPVTMQGKAARAAGFPDWLERDLAAEAASKGLTVEEWKSRLNVPASDSHRMDIAAAKRAIETAAADDLAELHSAMVSRRETIQALKESQQTGSEE